MSGAAGPPSPGGCGGTGRRSQRTTDGAKTIASTSSPASHVQPTASTPSVGASSGIPPSTIAQCTSRCAARGKVRFASRDFVIHIVTITRGNIEAISSCSSVVEFSTYCGP